MVRVKCISQPIMILHDTSNSCIRHALYTSRKNASCQNGHKPFMAELGSHPRTVDILGQLGPFIRLRLGRMMIIQRVWLGDAVGKCYHKRTDSYSRSPCHDDGLASPTFMGQFSAVLTMVRFPVCTGDPALLYNLTRQQPPTCIKPRRYTERKLP